MGVLENYLAGLSPLQQTIAQNAPVFGAMASDIRTGGNATGATMQQMQQQRMADERKATIAKLMGEMGLAPQQRAILDAMPPEVQQQVMMAQAFPAPAPAPEYKEVNGQLVQMGPNGPQVALDLRTPEAPAARFDVLGPAQAAAMGLDPARAYQRNAATGQIDQIGGNGVTVNANVNNGQEGEFGKTIGKMQGEQFGAITQDARAARGQLSTFSAMEREMAKPGYYSGAGGQSILTLKRLGKSLGMDVDGVESMEAFNALAKTAVMDSLGGSLGAGVSNADVFFLDATVPNLGNTPEGNRTLIDINRKMAERKIQIAELATEYRKTHSGGFDGFDAYLDQWANAHPMFEGQPVPVAPDNRAGAAPPMRIDPAAIANMPQAQFDTLLGQVDVTTLTTDQLRAMTARINGNQ